MGGEARDLSPEMQARCSHIVKIPTKFCINVALAGAATFTPLSTKHGRLLVKFDRAAAGPSELTGTFKLSVCSADVCQIEQVALAVAVP